MVAIGGRDYYERIVSEAARSLFPSLMMSKDLEKDTHEMIEVIPYCTITSSIDLPLLLTIDPM